MESEQRTPSDASKGTGGVCVTRLSCGISIVSCFLVHCTLGFVYSFGNITPYVTSYLRNSTGDADLGYTDTLWLAQTLSIAACVYMIPLGLISNHMPAKLYLLIGTLFTAASQFGTYWSVQTSFPVTVVTYGIVGGVPLAMLYPPTLRLAVTWAPADKMGFITGVIITGYGSGAFAWNQLTTWYINPHNLQPDVKVGEDVYYSQPEVLEKVPGCFLLLGGVFTAIQLSCVLAMCQPPSPSLPLSEKVDSKYDGMVQVESQTNESTPLVHGSEKLSVEVSRNEGTKPLETKTQGVRGTHQYHPKELVTSRVFWTLWGMMFITQLGTVYVINLSKAYGQTFIADDRFLSLAVSFSGVANAVARPISGLLADKIGCRMVAVYAQCILACLVATFVTCEVTGSRVAFFVWVFAMSLATFGLFTMIPALTMTLFGSQYFNANVGVVESYGIIGGVLPVLTASILKDTLGWHGIFFVGFGGIFAGLLLNLSLDLRCGKPVPSNMMASLSLNA